MSGQSDWKTLHIGLSAYHLLLHEEVSEQACQSMLETVESGRELEITVYRGGGTLFAVCLEVDLTIHL